MSDEAKVARLKERINEIKNRERWMTILYVIGLGGILCGWAYGNTTVLLMGIILLVFGFAEGWHYHSRKNKLITQLRKIDSTAKEE